jgi:hypothetical protein
MNPEMPGGGIRQDRTGSVNLHATTFLSELLFERLDKSGPGLCRFQEPLPMRWSAGAASQCPASGDSSSNTSKSFIAASGPPCCSS